ncbi:hypothetical protein [Paenarthrobacter sp. CAP02]|uniref:hypothetical protein n=1 Tax=Paenarthrobacter sp. CAP02 TaxID=3158144 RepID=UPI0032DBBC95
MLDQKTLDHLWNFGDPAASEARFRAAMVGEMYDADERAELATQLGRAIGLQGRFEEADALHMLSIADSGNAEVWMRSGLEYASSARDERTKRWMIALHAGLGSFLRGKNRLTEAMVEFQLAEQWAERLGTERQGALAREAITECGKALAEGP